MQSVNKSNYLDELKKRGARARVTRDFQFLGLEIAAALKDLAHKSLYIKYAKRYDPQKLLSLAKDIAQRRDIKNPGAYFMKVVSEMKNDYPHRQ